MRSAGARGRLSGALVTNEEQDELLVDTEYNVAFGERKRPRLVGKLESK